MSIPEFVSEDSFVWIAQDLPSPGEYASALLMAKRDLARELLAAHKTATGWKYRFDPDLSLIRELRSLGLCETQGWHLSNFAILVRNRIIEFLKTRELEVPLENQEP